jgi:SET domain-containing protein
VLTLDALRRARARLLAPTHALLPPCPFSPARARRCATQGPHGSVARFVNHSCDPNLFVQNVHVHRHDLRWPVICLFALRAIPAGEELTYDYNYVNERAGLDGEERTPCTCGAANCCKWFYGGAPS